MQESYAKLRDELDADIKRHDELFPMPAQLRKRRFDETLKFARAVAKLLEAHRCTLSPSIVTTQ